MTIVIEVKNKNNPIFIIYKEKQELVIIIFLIYLIIQQKYRKNLNNLNISNSQNTKILLNTKMKNEVQFIKNTFYLNFNLKVSLKFKEVKVLCQKLRLDQEQIIDY
jgi:hypothetical protein